MIMVKHGKAFEFALAQQLCTITNTPLAQDSNMGVAERYYHDFGTEDMYKAASEAVFFLSAYDSQFDDALSIHLLPDSQGKLGDPRDIVVKLFDREIGLSAKHHHTDIKHPRLSGSNDFAKSWANHSVSDDYREQVRPVFDHLSKLRDQGTYFRDIEDKNSTIYSPILNAFEQEFRRLCESYGQLFIGPVFQYLVGMYDYYKVVKQPNYVSIHSYNMNGTLEWGQKWDMPNGIEWMGAKSNSVNTLVVSFDGGWRISFRIHNASSLAEPSLKFAIQIEAMPVKVATHQIQLV